MLLRFLIDTFGREILNQGSGVLDIAGGKGELSFELLNLNGINATVVEPRALQLWRQHKWMLVGPMLVNLACCTGFDVHPTRHQADISAAAKCCCLKLRSPTDMHKANTTAVALLLFA